MAAFLEMIQSDLNIVNSKVERAFHIRPGNLNKFAHLDMESLQNYLHPSLVLFSGRLFKYTGEKLIHLASVIQLIYLASSVHFRIPDDNSRTAVKDPRDGAQLPVLVGDYIYGEYFVGLCDGKMLEFLKPLSEIIAQMNFGALLRKKNSGYAQVDDSITLKIIEKETALLMGGATRFAGTLAGVSKEQINDLEDFGRNFGIAYGILERNIERTKAEKYFDSALMALHKLPPGEARDNLEEMLKKIRNGELAVPTKKTGRSRTLASKCEVVIPSNYKNKEEYVHSIFSQIAKKYDILNTVLSLNQDKHWRRFTVEKTKIKPGHSVLDVCCGTGMITVELAKKAGVSGNVVGLDFCEEMLDIARENIKGTPYENSVKFIRGNAMELPFPDNTFDCATIGFGLRNVPDRIKTIREMMRVIKPGGRIVCLEFSKPTIPVFKQIYNFYFDKCVPFMGKLGVGMEGPYRYLHNSWKVFPHQKDLCDEFAQQGLEDTTYYQLTGGVVSVHVGVKPVNYDNGTQAVCNE